MRKEYQRKKVSLVEEENGESSMSARPGPTSASPMRHGRSAFLSTRANHEQSLLCFSETVARDDLKRNSGCLPSEKLSYCLVVRQMTILRSA